MTYQLKWMIDMRLSFTMILALTCLASRRARRHRRNIAVLPFADTSPEKDHETSPPESRKNAMQLYL